MFNRSAEEVEKLFKNKYEAVIVVAKEARRANQYAGEEKKAKGDKPINRAILKALQNKINFTYETTEEDQVTSRAKTKNKEKIEK